MSADALWILDREALGGLVDLAALGVPSMAGFPVGCTWILPLRRNRGGRASGAGLGGRGTNGSMTRHGLADGG